MVALGTRFVPPILFGTLLLRKFNWCGRKVADIVQNFAILMQISIESADYVKLFRSADKLFMESHKPVQYYVFL